MSRDPDEVSRRGSRIAILVVLAAVVAMGVWAVIALAGRMSRFWFPADHGVSVSSEVWLRCAVETIEEHPEQFGAEHGFLVESRQHGWLVRGTWLDTWIQVGEGKLVYRRADFRHSRDIPLDCPAVRPSGSAESLSGFGWAGLLT